LVVKNFELKEFLTLFLLDGIAYDGSIKKKRLENHLHVFPLLKDFVYDVRYKIVSYDFIIQKKNKEIFSVSNNKGSLITGKIKNLISNSKTKDVVFFQNIVAVGPDGKRRKLNPIVLTIR